MPKSKQQKQVDLDELLKRVRASKSMVFAEYRGTKVKDVDKVRRALEKEQIQAKVYKLTLLERAFKDAGIEVNLNFKVPVVMASSETDDTAPARILKKFSKEVTSVNVLGGVVNGQGYNKEQMMALADLPSKQEMLAKLVGTINAPVSGFVNVLAGNLRGLVNVLNAIAQK